MYWIQYLSDAFGTCCNDVEVKVTFEGWCHVGKGLQDICTPFRLSHYRKFDCHHINIRESGKTELEAWLIILPFYHITDISISLYVRRSKKRPIDLDYMR